MCMDTNILVSYIILLPTQYNIRCLFIFKKKKLVIRWYNIITLYKVRNRSILYLGLLPFSKNHIIHEDL